MRLVEVPGVGHGQRLQDAADLLPVGRLVAKVIADGGIKDAVAAAALAIMAVLCGVFEALCVRTFILARRSRAARQAP